MYAYVLLAASRLSFGISRNYKVTAEQLLWQLRQHVTCCSNFVASAARTNEVYDDDGSDNSQQLLRRLGEFVIDCDIVVCDGGNKVAEIAEKAWKLRKSDK